MLHQLPPHTTITHPIDGQMSHEHVESPSFAGEDCHDEQTDCSTDLLPPSLLCDDQGSGRWSHGIGREVVQVEQNRNDEDRPSLHVNDVLNNDAEIAAYMQLLSPPDPPVTRWEKVP